MPRATPEDHPVLEDVAVDPALLARAIVFGFTVAAAVGPISLLTIRRTIAHGRAYGLASGLGVALADATYAAIAAFGLTAITSLLVGARTVLGVVGGLAIVYIGLRTVTSRPTGTVTADSDRPGLLPAFASIYGLTLANPMTILTFVALFAVLRPSGQNALDAVTLVLGVFLGSLSWWVVLTTVVASLRSRVTPERLVWVNRVSGAALVVFGFVAVVSALRA